MFYCIKRANSCNTGYVYMQIYQFTNPNEFKQVEDFRTRFWEVIRIFAWCLGERKCTHGINVWLDLICWVWWTFMAYMASTLKSSLVKLSIVFSGWGCGFNLPCQSQQKPIVWICELMYAKEGWTPFICVKAGVLYFKSSTRKTSVFSQDLTHKCWLWKNYKKKKNYWN